MGKPTKGFRILGGWIALPMIVLCPVAYPQGAELGSSFWPTQAKSNQRSGVSTRAGPTYPAVTVLYETTGADFSDSYPSLDTSGNLYFADNGNNKVLCTDSNGQLRWATSFNRNSIVSYVALDNSGNVYLSDTARTYSFDSSGTLRWQVSIGLGQSGDTPVIVDGKVIFHSNYPSATNVIALDASNGTTLWQSALNGATGAVAVYDNMAISSSAYNASYPYILSARRISDGQVVWSYAGDQTGSYNYTDPTIQDGVIYHKTGDWFTGSATTVHVYATNANDGSLRWEYALLGDPAGDKILQIGSKVLFLPQFGYTTSLAKRIIALDKTTGQKLWELQNDDFINAEGGAGDANGIYFLKNYGIDTNTGQWKWKITGVTPTLPHTLDESGNLYFGYGTRMYRVKPWTLSVTTDQEEYHGGDVIHFVATSTMPRRHPVTQEEGKVQVILPDGSKLLLGYDSTDSSSNSVWKASWNVPRDSHGKFGTLTAEVAQAEVQTDTTVHFDSAPTNGNNTGITTTVTYQGRVERTTALFARCAASPIMRSDHGFFAIGLLMVLIPLGVKSYRTLHRHRARRAPG